MNGIYYIWGNCGKEEIKEPKETQFESFNDIFAEYFQITYKTLCLNRNKFQNEISQNIPVLKSTNIEEKIGETLSTNNRFAENISKSFNDPKYSDLKFKIEDKHIYVHKVILQINSKYFESKLTENARAMRESTENRRNDNEIEIKEYSYDVYYAFLKYLYTDSVVIETEKVMDLLVLANNYKEEELKQKCLDIITKSITIENVCSRYCYSIRKGLNELENQCFEFAFNNLKEVMKTERFQQMDENSAKSFKIKVFDKQFK
jgi:RCC1 and BTB domain-containing protein